jgi:TRAP-type uncharacterized transport system fused permease subunit
MKKIGYKPDFTGATEAAASTGGQLIPPIMGAKAFIMAGFLGIPCIKIAACAVIPSFLHFFAVGWMGPHHVSLIDLVPPHYPAPTDTKPLLTFFGR